VDLRHQAGLSQAGLAQRLGKPPSFVGKYELGERRLDVVELAVILQALGAELPSFWTSTAADLPERL
jgi:transcriptional regulator with XRE-family HTH domain